MGHSALRPIGSKLRKRVILKLLTDKQESPFPMTTIAELSPNLQQLLTEEANALAKKQASSNDSDK